VTLALEGHRITAGVGANRAIAVNVQIGPPPLLSNIHILGPGLITNGGGNTFSAGVSLGFALNSEVSGITVLGSGAGISAGDCTNLTITANTFGRNGLGISLADSNATISDNDASGNGTGIFVADERPFPPTGTVSHNVLNGNTGVGLSISSTSPFPGLTVQNNVINGNGQSGILVSEFALSQVINNTSLANGMFDLFDEAPGCSGHVWSGNTFFTANQSCIH
jgi:parallel beta-helix repeat protein